MLRPFIIVLCVKFLVTISVSTTLAGLITWEFTSGGNGHVYDFIHANGIEWQDAKNAAESLEFKGVNGHLATITSIGENEFISDLLVSAASDLSISNLIEAWLGAEQLNPSGPAIKSWSWITAEPFSFTNWDFNEPNDASGGEQYLGMWGPGSGADGPLGKWNDQGGPTDPFVEVNIQGYVVEFDIPASPIPEPSSLMLLSMGGLSLSGYCWRRKQAWNRNIPA